MKRFIKQLMFLQLSVLLKLLFWAAKEWSPYKIFFHMFWPQLKGPFSVSMFLVFSAGHWCSMLCTDTPIPIYWPKSVLSSKKTWDWTKLGIWCFVNRRLQLGENSKFTFIWTERWLAKLLTNWEVNSGQKMDIENLLEIINCLQKTKKHHH